MRFEPISITPQQERSTTPDKFITDQYGKLPELHGDGPLTINEAIRLSKIVNGYSPAFVSCDNQIIWGFYVGNSCLKLENNGRLIIRIPPGAGIIYKLVFRIPIWIEALWENFSNTIPPKLQTGKILLYFTYKDKIENTTNRP